jgi:hypothetical protein
MLEADRGAAGGGAWHAERAAPGAVSGDPGGLLRRTGGTDSGGHGFDGSRLVERTQGSDADARYRG